MSSKHFKTAHTKTNRIRHEQCFPSGLCLSHRFKKLPLRLLAAHISWSRLTNNLLKTFKDTVSAVQEHTQTTGGQTEGKLDKKTELVLAPCPSSLSALGVPGGKTRNFPLVDNCGRRSGCKNGHKPQVRPSRASERGVVVGPKCQE